MRAEWPSSLSRVAVAPAANSAYPPPTKKGGGGVLQRPVAVSQPLTAQSLEMWLPKRQRLGRKEEWGEGLVQVWQRAQ